MQYDVLDRIREQYKGMSKGHKKIASFILEHYDQAVFMTAARLGDALRISESTVVRFAAGIGYRGYPEFQRALEECVQNKLSSVQKIDAKYEGYVHLAGLAALMCLMLAVTLSDVGKLFGR